MKPLPCPFCGEAPEVGPENPSRDGNAFGFVRCIAEDCPANPSVRDAETVSDDRGSDAYRQAAIARWNRRGGQ